MKDFYKLLEVDRDASIEVIEKAYRTLAKKYHPDGIDDSKKEWANEKMIQLNEAYAVLKDNRKRRSYDDSSEPPLDVFLNEGLVGLFKQWLVRQNIK